MALNLAWDALINAGSGLVMLLFGLWLLTLRPRRKVTLGLGLFAPTLGLFFIVWKLIPDNDPVRLSLPYQAAIVALIGVAVAGLILVALYLPRPLRRDERRLLVLPGLVAAAWGSLILLAPQGSPDDAAPLEDYLAHIVQALYFFALFLAAGRHAALPAGANARTRTQLRAMSAALVLYPAAAIGHGSFATRNPLALAGLAVLALLCVHWLYNIHRAPRTERATCRNLALLGLAVAFLSMLIVWGLGSSFSDAGGPHWGLVRMAGVLILGYAVLQYQILGIDVKVKWTIRQSTVALVFLVVIFLVSEGAQLLFSEDAAWLGLVAGAALIFGLSPIQRFAETVAERAMPDTKPVTQMNRDERSTVYLEAARVAWADGTLTLDERELLDGLRQRLGLPAEAAGRLEARAARGPAGG